VKTRRFTFLIGAIFVAATALVGGIRLGVGIQARRAGQSFSSTTPGLFLHRVFPFRESVTRSRGGGSIRGKGRQSYCYCMK
jgi:hypothetical protein